MYNFRQKIYILMLKIKQNKIVTTLFQEHLIKIRCFVLEYDFIDLTKV